MVVVDRLSILFQSYIFNASKPYAAILRSSYSFHVAETSSLFSSHSPARTNPPIDLAAPFQDLLLYEVQKKRVYMCILIELQ